MNLQFLIVFTSNGLVFATLLYLIVTCEIPDPKGSAIFGLWARIGGMMTRRRNARSGCPSLMVVPGAGIVTLPEGQERQIPSLSYTANKP
jgi:hypothetical protein